jgi:hypothetical protein
MQGFCRLGLLVHEGLLSSNHKFGKPSQEEENY